MNDSIVLWLWLKLAVESHSITMTKLIAHFKSIQAVYECNGEQLSELDFIDNKLKSALLKKQLKPAVSMLDYCERNGIGILTIDNDKYPELLKNIYNPPCVLFYLGDLLKIIDKPSITIAGTRRCTPYAEAQTKEISARLSMIGFNIVTGFSSGIETAAAISAAKCDGSVICIIIGGLMNKNFMRKSLFQEVLVNGAVVSECFPLESTNQYSYYERNRLLSGMSLGTLVMQAPAKSGSLMIANYALDQGRDVFALMANVDTPESYGSNQLIRQGAKPVLGFEDVLEEYIGKYPLHPQQCTTQTVAEVQKDKQAARLENKREIFYDQLDADERKVFDLLSDKELSSDYIIENSGMPIGKVMRVLTQLETMGAIISCPGDKYKIL